MGRKPSPPPPPPPPLRQPYKWEKEQSMKNRNDAFAYAIEAARSSYTSAVIVKTLADRLLPITEEQLRKEIDEHYRVVTDYQKARIIYNATANTFLHVDGIIASSLDKLDAIRDVGEISIDALDTNYQQMLTKYNSMLSYETEMQKVHSDAFAKLEQIKRVLETAYTSTATNAYAEADAIIAKNEIEGYHTKATSILTDAQKTKNETDVLMQDAIPTTQAEQTRTSANEMVTRVMQALSGVTATIVSKYNTDVTALQKELERLKKWQVVYRSRSEKVRNRENIVLNGDVFIRLLYWARNAHINAIYSAMHAFTANRFAYQDVNYPF